MQEALGSIPEPQEEKGKKLSGMRVKVVLDGIIQEGPDLCEESQGRHSRRQDSSGDLQMLGSKEQQIGVPSRRVKAAVKEDTLGNWS